MCVHIGSCTTVIGAYTIQHRTVQFQLYFERNRQTAVSKQKRMNVSCDCLIVFPPNLQTITKAQMLSIGGEVRLSEWVYTNHCMDQTVDFWRFGSEQI